MSKKPNDNLYKFSVMNPWQFTFVIILYLIGAVSVPNELFTFIFGDGTNGRFISQFFVKAILCVMPFWLIYETKCRKILSPKGFFKNIPVILPFLLVAVNNFPIVSLIEGKAVFCEGLTAFNWIFYLLAIFSAALLEEITFRGLIFPAMLRMYADKKHGDFYAVLFSSSLFGLVHIVNLLQDFSAIGAVTLQVGYTFLIGAMCATAFLKTGNFHHAVLLHFVYNIGGLLTDHNMAAGTLWTLAEVAVTAVLAVLVICYAVYILLYRKKENLHEKLLPGTSSKDGENSGIL